MLTPAQLRELARKSLERQTRPGLRKTGRQTATQSVLRELGTFGDVSADVIRFARGGSVTGFLGGLLRSLGPVAPAIKAILGGQKINDPQPDVLQAAIDFLGELGLEVRLPGETIHAGPKPGIDANKGTGTPNPGKTGKARVAPPRTTGRGTSGAGGGGGEGEDEPSSLPTGRFVQDKYIPMELVNGSSNVYAIGYHPDTQTMRVQFLGSTLRMDKIRGSGHKGKGRAKASRGVHAGKRGGPGAVYDYFNVPPRVFARVQRAGSKGKAIWDNLRVRGTVYGHQYDYQLSAASVADVVNAIGKRVARITYVPRKAVGPGQFKGRDIRQGVGRQAQTFRSILPNVGMGRRRP